MPTSPIKSIIIMGVSGSGKSTIGCLLAERLGWEFRDADDDHPAANVAKMKAGIPLNDDDRAPWLAILAERIAIAQREDRPLVLACSALKQRYRNQLAGNSVTLTSPAPSDTPKSDTASQDSANTNAVYSDATVSDITNSDTVKFVYLKGTKDQIAQRMSSRDHFMPPALLDSQFAALEEPTEALIVSIAQSKQAIVDEIIAALNLPTP